MTAEQAGEIGAHERLQALEGDWDVHCTYFVPGGDPLVAPGHERVGPLGPYWRVAEFRCQLAGKEIVGQACSGYDPEREVYVHTWKDSATPYLYSFDGRLRKGGELIEFEGMNTDPHSGSRVRYRCVMRFLSADERTTELFVETGPDEELQVLEYRYRRAPR